MNTKDP